MIKSHSFNSKLYNNSYKHLRYLYLSNLLIVILINLSTHMVNSIWCFTAIIFWFISYAFILYLNIKVSKYVLGRVSLVRTLIMYIPLGIIYLIFKPLAPEEYLRTKYNTYNPGTIIGNIFVILLFIFSIFGNINIAHIDSINYQLKQIEYKVTDKDDFASCYIKGVDNYIINSDNVLTREELLSKVDIISLSCKKLYPSSLDQINQKLRIDYWATKLDEIL